jgi:hypothetical protein
MVAESSVNAINAGLHVPSLGLPSGAAEELHIALQNLSDDHGLPADRVFGRFDCASPVHTS